MAKILHNGIYHKVIVDDYFPVDENGKFLCSTPAGIDIWVLDNFKNKQTYIPYIKINPYEESIPKEWSPTIDTLT